ncbi:N-acetyl-gamma-glutamyl-phosphate reductase [Pseudidiomarina sp. CB1]|uniref:N-acetyl-gamma-glutamyl-phosphate reductase n=1 Tax=Pseudidiomarina sp. CB1 TaxID=2972484 RepID=UPI0021610FD4|nr:N-acetyl-gamma-glutamyl-phosphate reductase [Pseudidiomarina sp. CB1]
MSKQETIQCAVFGASGYSGVELLWLLHNHPVFDVTHAFSSSAREKAEPISALYPQLAGRCEQILQPWHSDLLPQLAQQVRVVFLALPHEASAELAPELIAAGLVVFDLSGAFRLGDPLQHQQAYGFKQPSLAQPVPYGLAEFTKLCGDEPLIAVPGCYPTAASLALRPVMSLLATPSTPIVNAVSGVSGAGRKAAVHTSFCEVSLQAYGVAEHRHQPEMAQTIGRDVIFVPHLGNFKRGILATIYAQLAEQVNSDMVAEAFAACYAEQPLVRLVATPPKLQQVVGTPYCDIYFKVHGNQLILSVAIDNLLKGAAAQALQLANQYVGLPSTTGLTPSPGAVV